LDNIMSHKNWLTINVYLIEFVCISPEPDNKQK